MAQTSNAASFEVDDESLDVGTLDNTCPECGTDSIATYLDRYSDYEYCTNCDWSDEDSDTPTREQIGRHGNNRYDE